MNLLGKELKSFCFQSHLSLPSSTNLAKTCLRSSDLFAVNECYTNLQELEAQDEVRTPISKKAPGCVVNEFQLFSLLADSLPTFT
jgi:hypothetical protein